MAVLVLPCLVLAEDAQPVQTAEIITDPLAVEAADFLQKTGKSDIL